jgi:hypothetical protein
VKAVAKADSVEQLRSGMQADLCRALRDGVYLHGVNLFDSGGSVNKSSRIQLASVG